MVFHPQANTAVAHFFLHGEFLEGVPSQVVLGHTPESECERAGGGGWVQRGGSTPSRDDPSVYTLGALPG